VTSGSRSTGARRRARGSSRCSGHSRSGRILSWVSMSSHLIRTGAWPRRVLLRKTVRRSVAAVLALSLAGCGGAPATEPTQQSVAGSPSPSIETDRPDADEVLTDCDRFQDVIGEFLGHTIETVRHESRESDPPDWRHCSYTTAQSADRIDRLGRDRATASLTSWRGPCAAEADDQIDVAGSTPGAEPVEDPQGFGWERMWMTGVDGEPLTLAVVWNDRCLVLASTGTNTSLEVWSDVLHQVTE